MAANQEVNESLNALFDKIKNGKTVINFILSFYSLSKISVFSDSIKSATFL